jgi:hypothetical protein
VVALGIEVAGAARGADVIPVMTTGIGALGMVQDGGMPLSASPAVVVVMVVAMVVIPVIMIMAAIQAMAMAAAIQAMAMAVAIQAMAAIQAMVAGMAGMAAGMGVLVTGMTMVMMNPVVVLPATVMNHHRLIKAKNNRALV